MRIGAFLFDVKPAGIVPVLRALEAAGVLKERPTVDENALAELPQHPLVDALRKQHAPSLDELEQLLANWPSADGTLHLYAKLTAPAQLKEPLRAEASEALGGLPDEVDERSPIDPHEIVLTLQLNDPDGSKNARSYRGRRTDSLDDDDQLFLLAEGDELTDFAPEQFVELRAVEETCGYLAWALKRSKAYARPVYLASLD